MESIFHRNKKYKPVFVKHYAPNICLPLNMDKFAKCRNSTKNLDLLESWSGNLFIIPYQLTKFQTPSSDLADKFKMPKFANGRNSRKNLFKS